MEPLLLRAGEVAMLLGVGRSTVFTLLAAGELPVVRIGRSVRVPRAALERWIDKRTSRAANRAIATHLPEPPVHVPTCGPHRAD
jgi:excisionase family DNA binding protein